VTIAIVVFVAASCIVLNQTMSRTRRSASLRFAVAITYVLGLIANHPSLVTPHPETNSSIDRGQ
jgi:apolipoprotein N-acyltransferase